MRFGLQLNRRDFGSVDFRGLDHSSSVSTSTGGGGKKIDDIT